MRESGGNVAVMNVLQPQKLVASFMISCGVCYPEYNIRGDGGSANREPRTTNLRLVVQPGAIQLILEPLARPSHMLWSKT